MTASAALDDLRVLDLGMITAGAGTSVALADFGADVIKIESAGRYDPFRSWSQIASESGRSGIDFSPPFHTVNRGKRGASIDLKHPEGKELFLDLVEKSDIVVENFRRGVLERLGLGYDVLAARNPRVILLSLTSQGGSGPESRNISFGSTLDALGGLMSITGYDATTPEWSSNNVNYPDQLVTFFAPIAVLAAVRQREATGRGTWIDFSQRESVSFVMGEEIVARSAGGPLPVPRGNRVSDRSPHDVYPAREADRWVAISVPDDDAWRGLVTAIDSVQLAESRFATLEGRAAAADDIDAVISSWSRQHSLTELDELLSRANVPHSIVHDALDTLADEQLAALGFFQEVELPNGPARQRGFAARLSATPGDVRSPAPALGGDTVEVLTDVLGLGADAIAHLAEVGAIAPTEGYAAYDAQLATSL